MFAMLVPEPRKAMITKAAVSGEWQGQGMECVMFSEILNSLASGRQVS
jgi:hypothetical protein